jgi:hypothetical protein
MQSGSSERSGRIPLGTDGHLMNHRIGLPLKDRTGNPLHLTPAGLALSWHRGRKANGDFDRSQDL